ncbi:MAG: hypothetical protein V7709_19100 [Halioglobus sp.]
MYRLVLVSLLTASAAQADCPNYLNHEMQKLHSKEVVNLCEIATGQPILIINTASHCGYTKQFKGLEARHQQYRNQGLHIVGFPSNDFRQEAKNEEKAAEAIESPLFNAGAAPVSQNIAGDPIWTTMTFEF